MELSVLGCPHLLIAGPATDHRREEKGRGRHLCRCFDLDVDVCLGCGLVVDTCCVCELGVDRCRGCELF